MIGWDDRACLSSRLETLRLFPAESTEQDCTVFDKFWGLGTSPKGRKGYCQNPVQEAWPVCLATSTLVKEICPQLSHQQK